MKRLYLTAVLLLSACAAPLPQTPPSGVSAQVPAPQIRVGDEWTYTVRDGFTGLPRPTERHRVAEARGDQLIVAVTRDGIAEEFQIYDARWNWIKRPATNMQVFEYQPAYQALAFPLAAGANWHATSTATDPATGKRFPVRIDGTVLGWERVRVPAGEFDALKVRRVVFLMYHDPSVRERSEIIEIEWYAPAVRQAVRRDTNSRYMSYLHGEAGPGFVRVRGDRGGGSVPRLVQDDWLIYELSSHGGSR